MATSEAKHSTNELPMGIVVLALFSGLGTFIVSVTLLLAALSGAGP
jgi:hypothetical protein